MTCFRCQRSMGNWTQANMELTTPADPEYKVFRCECGQPYAYRMNKKVA